MISPVTEEVIGRVPDGTEADIDKAVAAARTAFDRGPWPRMTPAERGEILAKVAAQITAEMGDMAEIITEEMGSPISFASHGPGAGPDHDLQLLRRAGRRRSPSTRCAPACSTRRCW